MSQVLIRHNGRSVWHFQLKLTGKTLAAAKEMEMPFIDDSDVCNIVFGDRDDDPAVCNREPRPPHTYHPHVTMPALVWDALQKSKDYGKTVKALVKRNELNHHPLAA